jgi:hypothetical protein
VALRIGSGVLTVSGAAAALVPDVPLTPGPQAASEIVAMATDIHVANDGSKRRLCICACIPMIGSAHSFYGLEERIVKCVKTFASDDFSFANVSGANETDVTR